MIKLTECSKSFNNKTVLKNISFDVPKGSLYGFAGINGAGKSTLIKCIMQFLAINSGKIYFNDKVINQSLDFRAKIGYLPEVFQPSLDLKCREFLEYCYLLIKNKNNKETIDNVLIKVGLKEVENVLIRKFSKGMRQRLGIAQTIIHNPDLLILDEPFSGLDPIGRFELKQLLKKINGEGATIFFSSHNLTEIRDLCTHIAILHDGLILYNGNVDDLLKDSNCDNLEDAFLKTIHHEKLGEC
ncbi:MAG: hypothetical protein ACD_79C01447G0001 [uncultured bacterium]|nr:MAG: hypothetical protein ACD_79C01447G0001 [uncultured bacterium]